MKKPLIVIIALVLMLAAEFDTAYAQNSKTNIILIKNTNIFDGKNEKLAKGMSVLIDENKITKIFKSIPALILTKPEKNFALIMKDSKIYKDTAN